MSPASSTIATWWPMALLESLLELDQSLAIFVELGFQLLKQHELCGLVALGWARVILTWLFP